MAIRKLLLSCIILLVGLSVHAAPAIDVSTPTTGWTHGASRTITGTGFGTKSTAAPWMWDNAETGVVTDNWTNVVPRDCTGADAVRNISYRTTAQAATDTGFATVAQAHTNSTKYLLGGHADGGSLAGSLVAVAKIIGAPTRFYTSHYRRFNPEWDADHADNTKLFYHMNGSANFSGGGFYVEYPYGNIGTWGFNGIGRQLDPIRYFSGNTSGKDATTTWTKMEILAEMESDHLHVYVYEDGVCVLDTVDAGYGVTQGYWTVGPTRQYITTGGYTSMASGGVRTDCWRYFDDIYVDTTWQRVILGNSSTYANCSIREVQIPTAWATGEVGVTVNRGALTGTTAYLYVFDAAGDYNSTGYAITLGGGGDTTAPSLQAATVLSAGTSLTLTFDEAITVTDDDPTGWTIDGSGGSGETMAYSSGSGSLTLTYTIGGRTIGDGETVTLTYNGTSSDISDASSNQLATISSAFTVDNQSTYEPDITDPTVSIDDDSVETTVTVPSVTIYWTDSDVVGVTSRKWRIGAAPDATNGTTTDSEYTTSVTGLSSGANTVYIGAVDAAGNWGSDSIVITYNAAEEDLIPAEVWDGATHYSATEIHYSRGEPRIVRVGTTVICLVADGASERTMRKVGSGNWAEIDYNANAHSSALILGRDNYVYHIIIDSTDNTIKMVKFLYDAVSVGAPTTIHSDEAINDTPGTYAYRSVNATIDGDGYIYAFVTYGAISSLYCLTSDQTTNITSFTEHLVHAPSTHSDMSQTATVLSDGTLCVAWSGYSDPQCWFSRSTDNGTTWLETPVTVWSSGFGNSNIVADRSNNLYIFGQGTSVGDIICKKSTAASKGDSWGSAVVAEYTYQYGDPGSAIDSAGNIWVTFRTDESISGGTKRQGLSSSPDGTTWTQTWTYTGSEAVGCRGHIRYQPYFGGGGQLDLLWLQYVGSAIRTFYATDSGTIMYDPVRSTVTGGKITGGKTQ